MRDRRPPPARPPAARPAAARPPAAGSDPAQAQPARPTAPPAVVPAARGWRAGARFPRGHRSPLVRALVALTSSGALLAVAALVAAAAIVPPIGARRTARELASREVDLQLAPGESIVAQTFASQRRWTDVWRESFGILVATERRVLYVGAPPTPLLRPRDDGPSELLVESFPYDAAFTLEERRGRFPFGDGLTLRTPAGRMEFIVTPEDRPNARAVADSSTYARAEITRQLERLAESNRTAPPPATVYVPYVVRRGETLTQLARRFNTTPDILRQLNKLPGDDIRSGQRIRVPAVDTTRAPGTTAPPVAPPPQP